MVLSLDSGRVITPAEDAIFAMNGWFADNNLIVSVMQPAAFHPLMNTRMVAMVINHVGFGVRQRFLRTLGMHYNKAKFV